LFFGTEESFSNFDNMLDNHFLKDTLLSSEKLELHQDSAFFFTSSFSSEDSSMQPQSFIFEKACLLNASFSL